MSIRKRIGYWLVGVGIGLLVEDRRDRVFLLHVVARAVGCGFRLGTWTAIDADLAAGLWQAWPADAWRQRREVA